MRFSWLLPLTLLLGAAVVRAAPGAEAGQRTAPLLRSSVSGSRSLGFAWRGALEGGVPLVPGPDLRFTAERHGDAHRFGTLRLVRFLEQVASEVVVRVGLPLVVGELSGPEGGSIPGHRSHESGRDVDVGFYYRDAEGHPAVLDRFARVDGTGRARLGTAIYTFDAAATWTLVERMVAYTGVRLRHVFVSNRVRDRLLAAGAEAGADPALVERAAAVLKSPGAIRDPHDGHLHVRIACADEDGGACQDTTRPSAGARHR